MSGSREKKPHRSWQVKGDNSVDAASQNHENVTTPGRHDQQQGSSMFSENHLCGGQVPTDASSNDHMSGSLDRKPHSSLQVKGHNSVDAVSQNYENVTPPGQKDRQQGSSTFMGENHFRGGTAKQWEASSRTSRTDNSSDTSNFGSTPFETEVPVNLDPLFMESVDHFTDVSRLSLESAVESSCTNSGGKVPESNENVCNHENNEHSKCSTPENFDICPPKSDSVFKLKPSLLSKNREKRNEMKNSIDGPRGDILRSGMVLLKSYFSSSEQAKILKICRSHGLSPAGFYQPLFREGGKLHLKMMCFGEFWDPETNKYVRPVDRAIPPAIPHEFLQLVDRAIKDSHSLIAEQFRADNVEDILPQVNPDICLVNYYAKTGRLGLHQDKDEGRESLRKGIPIVSFSIGDTAEFLYGDQCDAETANKVMLESGDVLIFGGKSRHIFHGVSKIIPDTAPKTLLEETNFRSGRLNLTFRQHY
ncbi:uncharacterized protein LOC104899719 isoform X2 [Beta vulgaris subsp. vulgaris]|nr:uncharacterized protein LOC104899719 isoform X2 [Beta vulgaris subsp. vulgaris]